MKVKPQICVLGMGKFGYKVGTSLIELNHSVIGIDNNETNILRAQKIFTQVFRADVSHKEALEQIGLSDITHAVVSVGSSISTSAMVTMYLKEMKIPNVWVKALNDDHAKLLKKIGADEVFVPEFIAAGQLADRIDVPGIIQRLPFDSEMMIREITIDNFSQKTLREIDLTNNFGCQVIAVKKSDASNYRYIPKADDKLLSGDTAIIIGSKDALAKIKP